LTDTNPFEGIWAGIDPDNKAVRVVFGSPYWNWQVFEVYREK
jgi:hypothetical protein